MSFYVYTQQCKPGVHQLLCHRIKSIFYLLVSHMMLRVGQQPFLEFFFHLTTKSEGICIDAVKKSALKFRERIKRVKLNVICP